MPGSVEKVGKFFRKKASSLKNAFTGKKKYDMQSEDDNWSLRSEESEHSYRERSYSCDGPEMSIRKKLIGTSMTNNRSISAEYLKDKSLDNGMPLSAEDKDEPENTRRCWSEYELNKKIKKKPFLKQFLCVIPEGDADGTKYNCKPTKPFNNAEAAEPISYTVDKDAIINESNEDLSLNARVEATMRTINCENDFEWEDTGAKPKNIFKEPATSSGISSLSFSLLNKDEGPMMDEFLETARENATYRHSSSMPYLTECRENSEDDNVKETRPADRIRHAQSMTNTNITASGNMMFTFIDGKASENPTSPSAVMAVTTSPQNNDTEKLQAKSSVQMKKLERRQKITERLVFKKALNALTKEEGSRVVLLLGYAGDGKTITGMYLIKNAPGFKYTYVIRSVKEWGKIKIKEKPHPNTIVFFDNFLGIAKLSSKQLEEWEPVFDEIYSACTDGNVSVVIAMHKKVFDYYTSHHRRHNLFDSQFIMDMSKDYRLSGDEKVNMVTDHLKACKGVSEVHICENKIADNNSIVIGNGVLQIWNGTIERIKCLNYPIGFPKAVERFTSCIENIMEGEDNFLKPTEEVVKAIDDTRRSKDPSDKQIHFAIGMLILSGGTLRLDDSDFYSKLKKEITISNQKRTNRYCPNTCLKDALYKRVPGDIDPYVYLTQGLGEMLGDYVEKNEETFHFHCVSIYYSAALAYGKGYPNDIIDLMPYDFIQKYVGPSRVFVDFILHLELNSYTHESLAKRLMKAVEEKHIQIAMDHVAWGDKAFTTAFLQHVGREAKLTILFQTQDEHSHTVLYYGMQKAYNKCQDVNNFTEQVLKTGLWEKHMKKKPQLKDKQERDCLKLAVNSGKISTAKLLIERMKCIDDGCFESVIQAGSTDLLFRMYKYPTYRIDICKALIKTCQYHYESDPATAIKFAMTLLRKEKDLIIKCHLRNALKEAVESDDTRLFDMLQALGADTNLKFREGNLLHLACTKGHANCVERLLDSGIDNSLTAFNGMSALHIAIENGHYEIASMLFKRNNQLLTIRDKTNRQPLHIAVIKSDITQAFVNEMIDYGADVGAKSKGGRTPLHLAITVHNLPIVKVLTTRGATVTVKDSEGQSPIILAYKENLYYEIEAIFRETGQADFYEVDLLFKALEMQEKSMVKCMLQQIDVNIKNSKGNTLLHVAIQLTLSSMVQLLLQQEEIDLELSSNGLLPIHKAVLQGDPDIFKLVMSRANTMSVHHRTGDTILHMAAKHDLYDIVDYIIRQQPELVTKTNKKGETPILQAVESGHENIVDLLICHFDQDRDDVVGELLSLEKLATRKRNISEGRSDAHYAKKYNTILRCLHKKIQNLI